MWVKFKAFRTYYMNNMDSEIKKKKKASPKFFFLLWKA